MIPEQPESKKPSKKAKKDLLKLERPIYELKRSEEGKPESIIAKLMENKQKPQIGFLPRSQRTPTLTQSSTSSRSSCPFSSSPTRNSSRAK
jgi:hypothetical protein